MDSMLILATAFAERHAEGAVDALDQLPPGAVAALVSELPADSGAQLLAHMPVAQAADCLKCMARAKTVAIVRQLMPQLAADLLRRLDSDTQKPILAALARWRRVQLELVLRQPRQTVGAWMDTRIASARPATTVGDALKRLRDDGANGWLFVVGSRRQLLGAVRLGALMQAANASRIEPLMQPGPPPLRTNITIGAAIGHEGWRQHDTLPVVETGNRLVGVISHANLRRASTEVQRLPVKNDQSGTLMDVANVVYLGMAEVMNVTIARKQQQSAEHGPDGAP